MIVSFFKRHEHRVAFSATLLAFALVAGFAGAAFVNTSPFDPVDSVVMGVAFLVAFWASRMATFFVMMRGRTPWGQLPRPAPTT